MEKIHPNGVATYTADGAIARGEVVYFNSGKVKKCAAVTAAAIGIALDGAADGEEVPVAILGAFCGTVEVKATGAIAQGAKVDPTGATIGSGTHYIGVALEAASAAGDYVEIAHCVCV